MAEVQNRHEAPEAAARRRAEAAESAVERDAGTTFPGRASGEYSQVERAAFRRGFFSGAEAEHDQLTDSDDDSTADDGVVPQIVAALRRHGWIFENVERTVGGESLRNQITHPNASMTDLCTDLADAIEERYGTHAQVTDSPEDATTEDPEGRSEQ